MAGGAYSDVQLLSARAGVTLSGLGFGAERCTNGRCLELTDDRFEVPVELVNLENDKVGSISP